MRLHAPLDDSDAIAQGQSDALGAWSNAAATCVCQVSERACHNDMQEEWTVRIYERKTSCPIWNSLWRLGKVSSRAKLHEIQRLSVAWLPPVNDSSTKNILRSVSLWASRQGASQLRCWQEHPAIKKRNPMFATTNHWRVKLKSSQMSSPRHPHCGCCHFLLWDPTKYSCCPTMAM